MERMTPNAIAIPVGEDWAAAFFAANRLLRGGHRVLSIRARRAADAAPNALGPGNFLVPLNPSLDPGLAGEIAAESMLGTLADNGVDAVPIAVDGGVIAAPIAIIRIGLYGGGGAPFNHAAILAASGFSTRFLSDADVLAGALAEVDVFIVPGGGARAMHGQLEPLGEAGCRAIAEFVRHGGMYIGCCAGSYDCIVNTDEFVASCPPQRHLQLLNVKPWKAESAVEMFGIQSPGVGVVRVRTEQPDHPVMLGMPSTFSIVHYNGPVLDPIADARIAGASAATGLASFAGASPSFTPAESFAGDQAGDEPTYFAGAVAAERFAFAAGEFGAGRVAAFGSHPEFGTDLPMAEWFAPARMLANAVIWQATSGTRSPVRHDSPSVPRGPLGFPPGAYYAEVERLGGKLIELVQQLRQQPLDPAPGWLAPEYAMSVFGLSAGEIWQRAIVDIERLSHQAAALSRELAGRTERLLHPAKGSVPDPVRVAVLAAEQRLHHRRDATWNQDGGYQGILALLQSAIAMCDQAVANWEIELGPPAGPYAYLDTNPYHLVAGSYLAAIGVTAGAVQLLRVSEAELTMAEQLARDASQPSQPARELVTAGPGA